jgi:hypothetical protein
MTSAKNLERTVAAIQAGLKAQQRRPHPESAAGRWLSSGLKQRWLQPVKITAPWNSATISDALSKRSN